MQNFELQAIQLCVQLEEMIDNFNDMPSNQLKGVALNECYQKLNELKNVYRHLKLQIVKIRIDRANKSLMKAHLDFINDLKLQEIYKQTLLLDQINQNGSSSFQESLDQEVTAIMLELRQQINEINYQSLSCTQKKMYDRIHKLLFTTSPLNEKQLTEEPQDEQIFQTLNEMQINQNEEEEATTQLIQGIQNLRQVQEWINESVHDQQYDLDLLELNLSGVKQHLDQTTVEYIEAQTQVLSARKKKMAMLLGSIFAFIGLLSKKGSFILGTLGTWIGYQLSNRSEQKISDNLKISVDSKVQ